MPTVPDDYLVADDLQALGIDPGALPSLCPWATQYVALDGSPCWAVNDLFADDGGDA